MTDVNSDLEPIYPWSSAWLSYLYGFLEFVLLLMSYGTSLHASSEPEVQYRKRKAWWQIGSSWLSGVLKIVIWSRKITENILYKHFPPK